MDEIHRLNRQVEEVLYPAMEDFAIDIMIGRERLPALSVWICPSSHWVGATTRAGLLSAPLRDRFGVMHHLEFHNHKELKRLFSVPRRCWKWRSTRRAAEIAKRSRGNARTSNRLLKRVRDFAQVKYDGKITHEVAVLPWIFWKWISTGMTRSTDGSLKL